MTDVLRRQLDGYLALGVIPAGEEGTVRRLVDELAPLDPAAADSYRTVLLPTEASSSFPKADAASLAHQPAVRLQQDDQQELPLLTGFAARVFTAKDYSPDDLRRFVRGVAPERQRSILMRLASIIVEDFNAMSFGIRDKKDYFFSLIESVSPQDLPPFLKALAQITILRGLPQFIRAAGVPPVPGAFEKAKKVLHEAVWQQIQVFCTFNQEPWRREKALGRITKVLRVGYDDYTIRALLWPVLELIESKESLSWETIAIVLDLGSALLQWQNDDIFSNRLQNRWHSKDWDRVVLVLRKLIPLIYERDQKDYQERKFLAFLEKIRLAESTGRLLGLGFSGEEVDRLFEGVAPMFQVHMARLAAKAVAAGLLNSLSGDLTESREIFVRLVADVPEEKRSGFIKGLEALATAGLVTHENRDRLLAVPGVEREKSADELLYEESVRTLQRTSRGLNADEFLVLRRLALVVKEERTLNNLLDVWMETNPSVRPWVREILFPLLMVKGPKTLLAATMKNADQAGSLQEVLAAVRSFFDGMAESQAAISRLKILERTHNLVLAGKTDLLRDHPFDAIELVPREGGGMITMATIKGQRHPLSLAEKRSILDANLARSQLIKSTEPKRPSPLRLRPMSRLVDGDGSTSLAAATDALFAMDQPRSYDEGGARRHGAVSPRHSVSLWGLRPQTLAGRALPTFRAWMR